MLGLARWVSIVKCVLGSLLLERRAECVPILLIQLLIRYLENLIVIRCLRSSSSLLVVSGKLYLWECISALRHRSWIWIVSDAYSKHRSSSHWCRALFILVFRIRRANSSSIIIISVYFVLESPIVSVCCITRHYRLKLVISGFGRRSWLDYLTYL